MPRIAVVDNDTALLELLGEAFAWKGWDLIPVTDEAACEKLFRDPPDVILLEPWLGGPDRGWGILQIMRRQPAVRDVPMIVWSGAVDRMGARKAWLEEHGIPLVEKPFDLDDLFAAIDEALKGSGKR